MKNRLIISLIAVCMNLSCTSLDGMKAPSFHNGYVQIYNIGYPDAYQLAKYVLRVHDISLAYDDFEKKVVK